MILLIESCKQVLEQKIKGKKLAPKRRQIINSFVEKQKNIFEDRRQNLKKNIKYNMWIKNSGKILANNANMYYDEHGYNRGDHLTTKILEFLPNYITKFPPFYDSGKEGLVLIEVNRKRIYASSSKWYNSYNLTKYLCGRNETGTYFSHAVPKTCNKIIDAIKWIWSNKELRIIQRQGDIALIKTNSNKRNKLPILPTGHKVIDDYIVHDQHPKLPLPQKGEQIIIGKRASAQVSDQTRD